MITRPSENRERIKRSRKNQVWCRANGAANGRARHSYDIPIIPNSCLEESAAAPGEPVLAIAQIGRAYVRACVRPCVRACDWNENSVDSALQARLA